MSDILVEPGDVHDDPLPRPETRSDPEIQPEADDRLRRYAAAKRSVDEANDERRKKGPRIGMNCFFFKSRLSDQETCWNWTELEERSVVRDLFIGRFCDSDVQSTLIWKNPDHAGTLKLALELEKGASRKGWNSRKKLSHNKKPSSCSLPKINKNQFFETIVSGLGVTLLTANRTPGPEKLKPIQVVLLLW